MGTDTTTKEQHGRDVFVAGPSSAAAVAALFAEAFSLPPARALTEDAPFQVQLDDWDGDHVLVYALEPGDFPFIVNMNFRQPIDVGRFDAMARAHDMAIAYAAHEYALYDDTYHIVDHTGTRTQLLSFDNTNDSYACNVAGAGYAAD